MTTDLLKRLCNPDSSKAFCRQPGLGCTLWGDYCTVATDGRALLAIRSDRLHLSDGAPALFADADVARLNALIGCFDPDAPRTVYDVGDLILWCGVPHFPEPFEDCEWPDRTGVLCGLPVDRVRLANYLHVAYWLCRPLDDVQARVCTARADGNREPCPVLFLTGLGQRGKFLLVVMPLSSSVPTSPLDTAGWPVFAGDRDAD